jgi:hypothetical protein
MAEFRIEAGAVPGSGRRGISLCQIPALWVRESVVGSADHNDIAMEMITVSSGGLN